MNMLVIFRTAWRSLTINKMRSVLTALGIIIGVASVIVMVSLGQGATSGITERISSMGTNILQIRASGGMGVMRGAGASTLTTGDAKEIAKLPYVKNVASVASSSSATVVAGSSTWNTSVTGTTPEMSNIKEWDFAQGGFFTQEDVDNMNRVAVIGKTVEENLYSNGSAQIGSSITINGLTFTVIGVLPEQGSSGGMQDSDDVIYIPLTTLQQRLTGSTSIDSITVQASDKDALTFLTNTITTLLRERHDLADDADDDFRIMDSAELLSTVEDTSKILTMLLGGIAGVSLLVGGIGVMNIMLVSVTERTREIGIRMAIGATTRDILNQFMVESIMLCIIGGLIGTLLGWGISRLFGSLSGWTMVMPAWAAIMAIAFSTIVGVVFGYYPARKAAELDPIEALHYE
ncbi:MAG TPA: ABC transporter permease [Syntrophomonadaceae bacterium]|nr:ABC transporter permease [Syntrophomonadaceae bacterium]